MLNLSESQRRHLAGQTTIGMNKYLLFWEKIGVFPTHAFLADTHYPAQCVLQESMQVAKDFGRQTHFLINRDFKKQFGTQAFLSTDLPRTLYRVYQRRKRWGFAYNPLMTPSKVTYFNAEVGPDAENLKWATSLDDPMYFWRGSLTQLMNLLSLLFPGRPIHLLGVDLDGGRSFFWEELMNRPELHDKFIKSEQQSQSNRHATAVQIADKGPITDHWLDVMEHAAETGNTIACCNPQSLLVREFQTPYVPVPEAPDA